MDADGTGLALALALAARPKIVARDAQHTGAKFSATAKLYRFAGLPSLLGAL